MTEPPLLELRCARASAAIAPIGAELRRWRIGETDLLWSPDPLVWAAVSPILFPIVGRLRGDRLRIGDRSACLGVHGFAARQTFELAAWGPTFARWTLADNAATREAFPFRFQLQVEYRLAETSLALSLTIKNADCGPMPYACGLHPGFRWPLEGRQKEGHHILFDRPVDPSIPQITRDGFFSAARRRLSMNGPELPLAEKGLEREALCFLDYGAKALRFVAPTGSMLSVEAANFDHWALWSCPPAPFLCLESWTGHGDPEDFDGDLFEKPSMRILTPGQSAVHSAVYSWRAAGDGPEIG